MENIDIKNFTRVSSVTDEDSVLLSRGVSSATHGQIAFGLFRSSVSKDISPSIVNGIWHIGSTNTGIEAKGADGKTPVFSTGTVATGLPDTNVIVQVRYDGINENGNPSYVIDFTIPAGKPGQDGDGAGNVYVTTDTLQSGKLYLFQPGADGSANGTMVEFDNQGGVGQQYPGYPGAEIFNDYTNNVAAGKNAHAEGQETNATGPRAHAEGYKTTVYAADAHAEGRETVCIGAQSHAEGMYSVAFGANSHVEGIAAQIENGTYTLPSEGRKQILCDPDLIRDILNSYGTLIYDEERDERFINIKSDLFEKYHTHGSLGERNHIEGVNNVACYNNVHIEGQNNIAGYEVTGHGLLYRDHIIHIEGLENICTNIGSYYGAGVHIEGVRNTCSGIYSKAGIHMEGQNNTVQGYMLISGSMRTEAPVTASHIEGQNNIITSLVNPETEYYNPAICSHVGGYNCSIKGSSYAFVHGYNLSISDSVGQCAVAFGKYNIQKYNDRNVLFAYGTGTSKKNRENAFAILDDKTVLIPKAKIGNMEEIIAPIQNRLTNMYNELTAIINRQQAQIDSLTSLITQLHPGLKVFVVGDRLVITSLMDADVDGNQLNISDADTKVTGDVLVFGEYVPDPEPPSEDAKAYVYLNTLYFTDLINASVDGSTLSISDTETTVTNGVLTIK